MMMMMKRETSSNTSIMVDFCEDCKDNSLYYLNI